MTTNKGELSVKVERLELLAKAVRPLPDKWKGLSDVDTRYRQRYVDLIVNEDARRTFEVRHAVVASIRRTLAERGFIEVETPVLHVEAGRRPRPPVRHPPQRPRHGPLPAHRPRAAPEAADRGRASSGSSRSAGCSATRASSTRSTTPSSRCSRCTRPSPTTPTCWTSPRTLIVQAARDALGTTVIQIGDEEVDLAVPWRRARLLDLVDRSTSGVPVHPSMPVDELRALCDAHGVAYAPHMGRRQALHGALRGPRRADAGRPRSS